MTTHIETYQDLDITITFTTSYVYIVAINGIRQLDEYESQSYAVESARDAINNVWDIVRNASA